MEQRLIDADALKKRVSELIVPDWTRTLIRSWLDSEPTVDAVPVDFINQKIVELQSCASQHFNDGNEMLATCVCETIRLLGSFLKEWRGKEKR